jgi:iron complex transport system substrate-binding protein
MTTPTAVLLVAATATIGLAAGPMPPAVAEPPTNGTAALVVSPTTGLDPAGQMVDVHGTGYATDGGIYVAYCAVTPEGQAPSPCGGSPGRTGGGAAWIASDEYALANGASAFGAGGSFSTQVYVTSMIGDLDCRKVRCAVVTRSDHRRIADRSLDVVVPVSFTDTDAAALPIAATGVETAVPATDAQVNPRIWRVATNPRAKLPVMAESADGRTVEVTDTSRIVVLNGSLAETVYTLGLGDRVVGRDVGATFKEAKKVPLVTRGHDVSAESVLARRPTLVLAQTDTGPADALAQIRGAGVPVVVFDEVRSIDEIGARELAVAEALGVRSAGEKLKQRTEAAIDAVRASVPDGTDGPRVAFLYMRGQAGVYLIGGKGSGADSMIEAAGAVDAGTAMGLEKAFTPITSEALAEAAPDVILMTTTGLESVGGIDGLVKIPGIAQTPAGKQRRVITEEDGLLFSFGARTPVALRRLVDALHDATARQ